MQQDAMNISEDLVHGIREIAIKYLQKYKYGVTAVNLNSGLL